MFLGMTSKVRGEYVSNLPEPSTIPLHDFEHCDIVVELDVCVEFVVYP